MTKGQKTLGAAFLIAMITMAVSVMAECTALVVVGLGAALGISSYLMIKKFYFKA